MAAWADFAADAARTVAGELYTEQAEPIFNTVSGVKRSALVGVPDAKEGEYVIVHAGFAISRMDEQEALETIRALDEIDGLSC